MGFDFLLNDTGGRRSANCRHGNHTSKRFSDLKKYYDPLNDRILCIGQAATGEYWDALWSAKDFRAHITSTKGSWLTRITKKYVSCQAKILEGGCGLGNHVYALSKSGYQVTGVDFASKTVNYLNQVLPELDIRYADVRSLPFEDEAFDGYWSLGVIEHFWDGYTLISQEMHRVLRKGGYLFITFPWMSPLRKYKARRMRYLVWGPMQSAPEGFYQYLLSSESVSGNFRKLGFELIYEAGLDGLKGIKDELESGSSLLSRFYMSRNFLIRALRYIVNSLMSNSCGHIKIMVFRKN